MAADSSGIWQILSKTRGKLQPAETITLERPNADPGFQLRLLSQLAGGAWLAIPESEGEAFDLLRKVGRVPLPPYIRGGEMIDEDVERYQTVYATRPGAIAAPTAGLHFTPELLSQLRDRGIGMCRLTLHVGIGTFRPIAAEDPHAHQMHAEWGEIDDETVGRLQRCRSEKGRIIAVGTTAVRVLETASQSGELEPWSGQTELFIHAPYQFRSVNALLTNFHLPRSTLLVLVHAFGGHELMNKAYEHAIQENFRFYSYGDAMLIMD